MFRNPTIRKALPATAFVGAVAVICLLSSPFLQTTRRGSLKHDDHYNNYNYQSFGISGAAGRPEGYSVAGSRLGESDGEDLVKESSRALLTAGVPGEGLLLAVANSDEDVVAWEGVESTTGEDQGGSKKHGRHWHKALQPLNK